MISDERAPAVAIDGLHKRYGSVAALSGVDVTLESGELVGLLLLDEPTSALDPAGRGNVRVLLGELRSRGIAVLLNSHLLSEIEPVCDRVVILPFGSAPVGGPALDLWAAVYVVLVARLALVGFSRRDL
jgi:ABC-type multidrug transport system ATPase subunit